MPPSALTTYHLSKTYQQPQGWRRAVRMAPVTAVQDITLTVPTGELFGLLGPNGAGKTTLVKMLCTLLRPTGGTAVVAGHDLNEAGGIRAAVGLVVSDERSFYWRLTARQNLDFFAALYGLHGAAARQRVQMVLAEVQLEEVAERRFSSFSSGMRQRLAIARALLHQPRLLFLDEPSRSLDPTATQKLHDLILRLRQEQGMTIFLITHDLAEAEKLCDRVALLHQGRIQAIGQPAALRRELRPQRQYVIQVGEMDSPALNTAEVTVVHTLRQQNVTVNGRTLTFQSAEEDGLLTAVLHTLHTRNIPIHTITSAPPSLEEVFAHYTGK
ncbi:MAG: ABC transporter ATP-binding protein [Chloroflexi bacterium]|nr:ABC transporter ATP-binding protein [Ardenticatenaceae bacterium]MBL1127399.1 ABC transporter ATP-binding protein [Chloroflexota bacterium]NOG33461.1 ABC transporter ATP-binding protein [Chloroflexota bacterium]GIK58528.1 MAG: daunorubicin resistance protein DrrA family ABC transporter ATP-binding protein [Chloroflexota bacterium]